MQQARTQSVHMRMQAQGECACTQGPAGARAHRTQRVGVHTRPSGCACTQGSPQSKLQQPGCSWCGSVHTCMYSTQTQRTQSAFAPQMCTAVQKRQT